jgi:hypothetical protein
VNYLHVEWSRDNLKKGGVELVIVELPTSQYCLQIATQTRDSCDSYYTGGDLWVTE